MDVLGRPPQLSLETRAHVDFQISESVDSLRPYDAGLYATGIRHWYAADGLITRGKTPTKETLLDLPGRKL